LCAIFKQFTHEMDGQGGDTGSTPSVISRLAAHARGLEPKGAFELFRQRQIDGTRECHSSFNVT
jgi:hypothetical protein